MSETLQLTLKRDWFLLMLSGKKKIEIRKPSEWIKSRLDNRNYRSIRFINGYGKDKPYFVCKYKSYEMATRNQILTFDDKQVKIEVGDYLIHLGEIADKGNLNGLIETID